MAPTTLGALLRAKATFALAQALDGDHEWGKHVATVRAEPDEDAREDRALALVAEHYLPRSTTHARREILVEMLLAAAEDPAMWCWKVAATGEGEVFGTRQRPARPQLAAQIDRGIRVLIRRGASACCECGKKLGSIKRATLAVPLFSHKERKVRRDYCEVCARRAATDPLEPGRDREAVRELLNLIGPAVCGITPWPRARRTPPGT